MTLALVPHPLADIPTIELLDYLATRLASERDASGIREHQMAMDRLDEAYMWFVAGNAAIHSNTDSSPS